MTSQQEAAAAAALSLMTGGGGGGVSAGCGLPFPPQGKDSRWLTLEVCREFQRNKCSRTDDECRFAHPPAHVEVQQNGRVVCCYDSIKGKCQRREPPCNYLHPPQHLREQLLQNGRQNLIIKNLHMQMLSQSLAVGQYIPLTAGPILNGSLSGPITGCYQQHQQQQQQQQQQMLGLASPLQFLPPPDQQQLQHLAQVSMAQVSMANGGVSAGQMKIDGRDAASPTGTKKRKLQVEQFDNPSPALTAFLPGFQLHSAAMQYQQQEQQQHYLHQQLVASKRTAVADSKSGAPVYQPTSQQQQQQQQQQQLAAAAAAAYHMSGGSAQSASGSFVPTSYNPQAELLCAGQLVWP